ncbi:MAG TPA: hypothetical protein VGX02_02110 [Candidatus Eremiobacteraceae bacterium]|nr:hypothetical protein [Candidatus Eremiobacteraceae bacterium]
MTFQAVASFAIWPYFWSAYRIRGWGRLPNPRGPTLCLANHQHDLDDKITISYMERAGPWDKTIYAVSGKRLFERGAMAWTVPWLEPIMRDVETAPLFYAVGMLPIENEIRSRPFLGFARAVYERHGDLPLAQVFRESALDAVGPEARGERLSYAFQAKSFKKARRTELPIKSILEPYRSELFEHMHADMEKDLRLLEDRLKAGATFWLTPEGRFTKNGRMSPMRTALWRLAPLAENLYTIAISYDVFVGTRLSMLFRVLPAIDRNDVVNSMKAPRPVTVSQLLADWLVSTRLQEPGAAFTYENALEAVSDRLGALPPLAWVEPELRASPQRMTRAALDGMQRLHIVARASDGYTLTGKRAHPQFPNVVDIVAHQAAFFEESQEAWRIFSGREG